MFCPECGRYLNSNVKACPYCGVSLKYNSPETVVEAPVVSEPVVNRNLPLFDFRDIYFTLGFASAVFLSMSLIFPWTKVMSAGIVMEFTQLDLLALKWDTAMCVARFYPLLISILGIISIYLLLKKREDRRGLYALFGIGLISCIGCFIFAYGCITYTGMTHVIGFYISAVTSFLLLTCSTKLLDRYYGLERKKTAAAKKQGL